MSREITVYLTEWDTMNLTYETADILANVIAEHFLSHPGKRNHEYKVVGLISEVVDTEGWSTQGEYDNWTYEFWHTFRPSCLHHSCKDCALQLRGVLAITSDTNIKYKYEVTDDFCERYLGWASLSPIA